MHSVTVNRAVVVCGAIWQPWWVMSGGPLDVVGIGNAIVDVLSHADDEFLVREGLVKGSMALIDTVRAKALYDSMGPAIEVSGGSAANTVAGLAGFGGRAGFVGRVRDDQLGAVFTHDLRALGVEFDVTPATEGPPTGRCLILVTPDAQRNPETRTWARAPISVPTTSTRPRSPARRSRIWRGIFGTPLPRRRRFERRRRSRTRPGGRSRFRCPILFAWVAGERSSFT